MRDLPANPRYRVFLNYPFDDAFEDFSAAMHFAVTAANLIPICAKDLTSSGQLRLQVLADVVTNCDYSAHDLSRHQPDGKSGFPRMNMPFETGMALYRSISSNWQAHRCVLLVTDAHAYKAFLSDLAGLDAVQYRDDVTLVKIVYEWLKDIGPKVVKSTAPSAHVAEVYYDLKKELRCLQGSQPGGRLSHAEMQEFTRRVCDTAKLWTWPTGPLADEFPLLPLMFEKHSDYQRKVDHISTSRRRVRMR